MPDPFVEPHQLAEPILACAKLHKWWWGRLKKLYEWRRELKALALSVMVLFLLVIAFLFERIPPTQSVKALTGTVISIEPPERPTKMVLGIEAPTKADAILLFSQSLPASALEKIKGAQKLDFSMMIAVRTFKDRTTVGVQTTGPLLLSSFSALFVWAAILREYLISKNRDATWMCELPAKEDPDKKEAAAKYVATTAENLLSRRRSDYDDVGSKLSSLLTIIGSGTGIVGLVTASSTTTLPETPLIVSAAFSLILVLVVCLAALRPRKRPEEDLGNLKPEDYNVTCVAQTTARLLFEASASFERSRNIRRHYYASAAGCFALAIGAIVLNFILRQ